METILKLTFISASIACILCAPSTIVDTTTGGDVPKIFINSIEASKINQNDENNAIVNEVKTQEVLKNSDILKAFEEETKTVNDDFKELNKTLGNFYEKDTEIKEMKDKIKVLDEEFKELMDEIHHHEKDHDDAKVEQSDDIGKTGEVNKNELLGYGVGKHEDMKGSGFGVDTENPDTEIQTTTLKEEVHFKPLVMANEFQTMHEKSLESPKIGKQLNSVDDLKYHVVDFKTNNVDKESDKAIDTLQGKVDKTVHFHSKDSIINSVEEDDSGNKVTNNKCKSRSSQILRDEISDDVSSLKPIYKVIYDVIKNNNATMQKLWIKILKENNKILQRRRRESDVFKNFLHNVENNLDIEPDDPFKSDDASGNKIDNIEVKGEKKLDDDTDVKYYHKKDNNGVKTKIDERKDNSHVHEENVFYHYSAENKNDELITKSVKDVIGDEETTLNEDLTPSSTSTTSTSTRTTTTTSTTSQPPSTDTVMNYDSRNFNDVNAMMNGNKFGNIEGNVGNVFKKMDANFENMENKLSNDLFGTTGNDIEIIDGDTTDQSPKRQVIEIKL